MNKYDEVFLVKEDLNIHPIAELIPPMDKDEYDSLKEDISGKGLIDPVIIYEDMILDGRHRYNICRELEIDVWGLNWESDMDPVDYVISENIKRRHLSKSQIAMVAAGVMDYLVEDAKNRQKESGEKYGRGQEKVVEILPQSITKKPDTENKAREKAGKLFNVSGRTIGDAQTIHKQGTEEQKQAVISGKASVSSTAKEVRERKKAEPQPAEKSKFNETNDNIEWAKYSWNPVTGCKYGCPYCYARDIAMRFTGHFNPEFHEARLSAPKNTKCRDGWPNNVFVCSMADLFGEWVQDEWISKIIKTVEDNPQWNFLFLTKNPTRYLEFEFPGNCWLGATVDTQERFNAAYTTFHEMSMNGLLPLVTFISMEPMNNKIDISELEEDEPCINWIIIGGRSKTSGMDAFQPEWGWVEDVLFKARERKIDVYFKPNLTVRPKELPGG